MELEKISKVPEKVLNKYKKEVHTLSKEIEEKKVDTRALCKFYSRENQNVLLKKKIKQLVKY